MRDAGHASAGVERGTQWSSSQNIEARAHLSGFLWGQKFAVGSGIPMQEIEEDSAPDDG